jgi:hypothetical protein
MAQEVLLLRSARNIPAGRVLLWQSFFYGEQALEYDFDDERFEDVPGDDGSFTSYTMLGYGLLDSLELLVQIPVHHRRAPVEDSPATNAGFGDLSLETRIMASDGSGGWPLIGFGVMLRFPTGASDRAPPLGDGSLDLGLSTIFTRRFGFLVAHLKLGGYFNGTGERDVDLGDELLYMLKGDFIIAEKKGAPLEELALLIGLNGKLHFEDRDADGKPIPRTRVMRPLSFVPMIKWTPVRRFFVRPKLVIPLTPVASGGKLYPIQYVLDLRLLF